MFVKQLTFLMAIIACKRTHLCLRLSLLGSITCCTLSAILYVRCTYVPVQYGFAIVVKRASDRPFCLGPKETSKAEYPRRLKEEEETKVEGEGRKKWRRSSSVAAKHPPSSSFWLQRDRRCYVLYAGRGEKHEQQTKWETVENHLYLCN